MFQILYSRVKHFVANIFHEIDQTIRQPSDAGGQYIILLDTQTKMKRISFSRKQSLHNWSSFATNKEIRNGKASRVCVNYIFTTLRGLKKVQ